VIAATIESREPARPDRIIGTFHLLGTSEIEERIGVAARVLNTWSQDAPARSRALDGWANAIEARGDAFADILVREVGKPVRESRGEVARAVAIIRYYAQAVFDPVAEVYPTAEPGAELRVHRRPVGVVAAICPWNFPVAIPVWKVAPALAYGNTALFKPSSSALATAHLLMEAAETSMPPGVLQQVATAPGTVGTLVDDRRVAAVSFTGSVEVGNDIVRRVVGRGALAQAEMGGQNPAIVLEDADIDAAASMIARAAMEFAGQKCTATRRVIVSDSIAAAFVPILVDAVRGLRMGPPEDESVDAGPVISQRARADVETALAAARDRGARLLSGGGRPPADGWFVEPTVLALDDPSDAFAQDETFGPAVAVLVARDDDHAVRIANGTRFGLAAAVYSQDLERARGVAMRLDAGMQRINAPTTGVDFHTPFGGEKASSFGPREQGRAAREFYTTTRTMLTRSLG
jgi:acyl-CoA reductase-like NAD-dependent aldehyde dehydrogenase